MRRPLHVHIHKTAGTAIRETLGIVDKPHQSALELRASVGRKEWRAGVPFAVVRNPWARMVSLFVFLSERQRSGMGSLFRQIAPEFGPWLRLALADENDGAPNYGYARAIRDLVGDSPLQANLSSFRRTQVQWMCGLVPDENVFRFERLAEEWPVLLDRLERDFVPLQRVLVAKAKPRCVDVYTIELRQLVARRFEEDIETFGYSFPGSAP